MQCMLFYLLFRIYTRLYASEGNNAAYFRLEKYLQKCKYLNIFSKQNNDNMRNYMARFWDNYSPNRSRLSIPMSQIIDVLHRFFACFTQYKVRFPYFFFAILKLLAIVNHLQIRPIRRNVSCHL